MTILSGKGPVYIRDWYLAGGIGLLVCLCNWLSYAP